jgi:hypothetical protein
MQLNLLIEQNGDSAGHPFAAVDTGSHAQTPDKSEVPDSLDAG